MRDKCGEEMSCGTTCSFDMSVFGACGWFNSYSKGLEWIYGKPSTPSSDSSGGQGKFMYINQLSSFGSTGMAYLSTLSYHKTSADCDMEFKFYMNGNSGNSLSLLIKPSSGQLAELWSTTTQKDSWQSGQVKIGKRADFAIILKATFSSGKAGNIAIDNIEFPPEQCGAGDGSSPTCMSDQFSCTDNNRCISQDAVCNMNNDCNDKSDESSCSKYDQCTFDSSLCNWTQMTDDDFDWQQSSSSPLAATGPNTDHSGSGQFLYIQSTDRSPADLARIVSAIEYPANTQGSCSVRFWYTLSGDKVGTLKVYTKSSSDSKVTNVWQTTGNQGNAWKFATVSISSPSKYKVLFEGAVGNGKPSLVAIDDVSFSPSCADPDSVTPKPSPGPCGVTDGSYVFCIGDRVCIPSAWVCDGNVDCPTDGYDESPLFSRCSNETTEQTGTRSPIAGSMTNENIVIIISVIGGILVLVLLIVIGYLYNKRVQQTKRFGALTTSSGMENPVYGDSFGETALTDFTATGYDTGMFAAELKSGDGKKKYKHKLSSLDNPLYGTAPATLPLDNEADV